MQRSRNSDLALYRRLFLYARPFWPHMAGIFLLSLLAGPIPVLQPLPLKIVVDSVIGAQPLPGFLAAVVPVGGGSPDAALLLAVSLLVAIPLVGRLIGLTGNLLQAYTGGQLVLHFRAQLFEHAQRLSLAYHDSKGPSDSVYRLEHDAQAIQSVGITSLTSALTSTLSLVGMFVVAAQVDWQLALVPLAVAPALFVLVQTLGRRPRGLWGQVYEIESAAMGVVQEALGALRVVKAFGQEAREKERFVRYSRSGLGHRIRIALTRGKFELLVGLIMGAGLGAALYIGAQHVRAGILTVGEFVLLMTYVNQLMAPLRNFSSQVSDLQSTMASAVRAFNLLDEAPEVVERADARALGRAAGAVAFRDVAFSYDGSHPVLRDITFDIPPGTRLGIAGPTGAGKTTLVSLLTRFYDPTAGQILLDGVDLREYRLADLRRQFAVVLQEPVLFSASVAENIAYARPGASEHEIAQAARAANAHEFVTRLPDGYETQVGDRGMRLSGGERQRIALARAFLRDAPLLILDEPTSSVDLKTEGIIVEAMDRLMRGRTAFVIAHRPSTLLGCDLLLSIEAGRLVSLSSDMSALVNGAFQPSAPARQHGAA